MDSEKALVDVAAKYIPRRQGNMMEAGRIKFLRKNNDRYLQQNTPFLLSISVII